MINYMEIQRRKEITWRAPEHEHIEREPRWFFGLGLVALLLVIFAIWQKSFFFAFFIVLSTILMMFFARNKPEHVNFKIDEKGLTIGNRFYGFRDFEEFAYRDFPGRRDELVFKRKIFFNPIIKIPIDERIAGGVLEMLRGKVKEVEHEETLMELFSDWLGF